MFSFYTFDSSPLITESLLSLKYFKKNKENIQREPCKRYEKLSKKKKKKPKKKDAFFVLNLIQIFLKIENKS